MGPSSGMRIGEGSAKVKHDCAMCGNEAPIDNSWSVVRPAGQPADAPEQEMPAHFKMLHGQGRDNDGLSVVHRAGLQKQHLLLLIDQHLHLPGMPQGLQHSLTQQNAVFLQAQCQRQGCARRVGRILAHTLITSPVSLSMISMGICS